MNSLASLHVPTWHHALRFGCVANTGLALSRLAGRGYLRLLLAKLYAAFNEASSFSVPLLVRCPAVLALRPWRAHNASELGATLQPNPSLKRTRGGMPRVAFISFWATRVTPPRAA